MNKINENNNIKIFLISYQLNIYSNFLFYKYYLIYIPVLYAYKSPISYFSMWTHNIQYNIIIHMYVYNSPVGYGIIYEANVRFMAV